MAKFHSALHVHYISSLHHFAYIFLDRVRISGVNFRNKQLLFEMAPLPVSGGHMICTL